jgi:hypothetical protein
MLWVANSINVPHMTQMIPMANNSQIINSLLSLPYSHVLRIAKTRPKGLKQFAICPPRGLLAWPRWVPKKLMMGVQSSCANVSENLAF